MVNKFVFTTNLHLETMVIVKVFASLSVFSYRRASLFQ